MKLIGVGERRYFGGDRYAIAIFQKEDGAEFDLPVNMDQMASILAESGQADARRTVRAPVRTPARTPAPAPAPSSFEDDMSDDEVEGTDTIRLASFQGGGSEFDDGDRL